MSQAMPIAPIPSGPTTVTADIPCRKCGYNLRGLSTDARCPECGIAVAASVSGDLLRFCDPEWVKLLARGTQMISLGVALAFFLDISNIATTLTIRNRAPSINSLAVLAGNVLIVIGSWWLTTPDPSGIGEDKYGTVRKIIRITLVIGIVNGLITLATSLTTLPPVRSQLV